MHLHNFQSNSIFNNRGSWRWELGHYGTTFPKEDFPTESTKKHQSSTERLRSLTDLLTIIQFHYEKLKILSKKDSRGTIISNIKPIPPCGKNYFITWKNEISISTFFF